MDLESAVAAVKKELKEVPGKAQLENKVINEFGRLFALENIDNITAEQFQDFCDINRNNHWTIHRHKTNITKDMKQLKKSLKILLNESIPITDRLKRLRERTNPDYQLYLGKAYFSPILLITNPNKYPVYNDTVKKALDKLDIYKDKTSKIWKRYPEVQKIILDLAKKYNLSLWEMDWVWWKVMGEKTYDDLKKFVNEEMIMQENYQPVVIKTLANVGGQTSREEIEEQLHLHNPESDSESMTNTVLQVLSKRKIIRKSDDDEYTLNLLEPLSEPEAKEIVNLCQSKIDGFEAPQFRCWIWAVTQENWEIVKQKNIWASKISEKIRDKVVSGDKVIFYVLGTGQFKGIFEFDGNWYDATKPVWADESDSVIYISQIHLIPLVFGDVIVYDIASELSIFEKSSL